MALQHARLRNRKWERLGTASGPVREAKGQVRLVGQVVGAAVALAKKLWRILVIMAMLWRRQGKDRNGNMRKEIERSGRLSMLLWIRSRR